jgi:uncharacterized protein (TIGR02996 family)
VSDLVALLDAVERDPADPLARGVLADWFDDRSDPRGALVRTSNELIPLLEAVRELEAAAALEVPPAHLLPEPPYQLDESERLVWAARALSERRDEAGREARLVAERLAGHYDSWFQRLRPEFGLLGFDYETFCGVVDTVHAPVSLWRRVRPEVVAPHPIRALYLRAEFGADPRVAPDTTVPLPHLRALAVSVARRWTGIRPGLPTVPASADLDFVRDCPWLGRAETLLLDMNSSGSTVLLAWAARELPQSKALCLPAVRLVDPPVYPVGLWAGPVREFCESPLMSRITDLTLGAVLSEWIPENVASLLRLPFGTVRTLIAEFLPAGPLHRLTAPHADIDPVLREVLTRAESDWARSGRVFRWRVVRYVRDVSHMAERVLRSYWSAADTSWMPPGLHYGGHGYHDEWDDDDGGGEDDPDWSLTPTRRELYRGRFRNPRRD